MIYPPFKPRVSADGSYVITRVTSVAGGSIVMYVTQEGRIKTNRIAFVADNTCREWDMITKFEELPRVARVRIKTEPEFECENCIGMIDFGCYCAAVGAVAPGGPIKRRRVRVRI